MKLNKIILTLGLSLTITAIPIYAGYSSNGQEPKKDNTTSSFEALKRKSKQNFNRAQNDSTFKAKVNKFASQNEKESYEDFRRKTKEEYATYKEKTIKEYLQYRDSVLGDFVNEMSKPWKQAESKAAEEKPQDESVEPERISEEEFLQMIKNLYKEDSTKTKNQKDSINQVVNATVYNDSVPTESLAEFTSNVSNKFLSFIKKIFKGKEQTSIAPKTKAQLQKVAKLTTTKKQAKAEPKPSTKVLPKTTVKSTFKAKVEPKKEAKPIVKKQEIATIAKEEPKKEVKESVKETVKVAVKDSVKKDAPKSVFLSGGEPQQISIKKVVSLADLNIAIQPTPFVPVITHDDSTPQEFKFTFFGTPLKVRIDDRSKFKLKSTMLNNKVISDAMKKIIKDKYLSTTLKDCLNLREDYYLCDWAYLQMLDKLCTDFFGGRCNESALLTGYLYSQSGYKMKFGYSSDNSTLFMLFTCDQVVSGLRVASIYDELTKDYQSYYVFNYSGDRFFFCDYTFPQEKAMSLYIKETPAFDKNLKEYEHTSKIYKAGINYSVNQNLIDFYNTYPVPTTKGDPYTKWSYYALTPLSDEAKATIYPTIKKHTNGMKDFEAVNIILDLIQTYIYEKDDNVWGYDRAFFPDETLFYPYCDCEDRAILFARVVNDILGLETALIYYPGHLAAAVKFKEDVKGDYILKDGSKYTVCDPTIQHIPLAGTSMSKYKGRKGQATLLLLNSQQQ